MQKAEFGYSSIDAWAEELKSRGAPAETADRTVRAFLASTLSAPSTKKVFEAVLAFEQAHPAEKYAKLKAIKEASGQKRAAREALLREALAAVGRANALNLRFFTTDYRIVVIYNATQLVSIHKRVHASSSCK